MTDIGASNREVVGILRRGVPLLAFMLACGASPAEVAYAGTANAQRSAVPTETRNIRLHDVRQEVDTLAGTVRWVPPQNRGTPALTGYEWSLRVGGTVADSGIVDASVREAGFRAPWPCGDTLVVMARVRARNAAWPAPAPWGESDPEPYYRDCPTEPAGPPDVTVDTTGTDTTTTPPPPSDTLDLPPTTDLPLVGADGFESGGLSAPTGSLTWDGPNRTHVRTADSLGIPPYDGDWVLGFRYDAGDSGVTAEQRFDLGGPLNEIKVTYALWIPADYTHLDSDRADNRKLLALWDETDGQAYNRDGFTFVLEAERADDTTSYFRRFLSRTRGLYPPPTSVALDRQDYWPDSTYNSQEINHEPRNFIGPGSPWLTAGEWHRVRVYVRSATCFECFDGYASVHVDGRLAKELTWNFWGAGPFGTDTTRPARVNAGYLMGWANAGYPAETWFAIDDVEIRGR